MTTFLLDTTVVIDHLRWEVGVRDRLLAAWQRGDDLAVSAVTIAEVTRGARPPEARATRRLLDRLTFLATSREAARRAGDYQRRLAEAGVTLHTADALIAGTARAHGAVLVTDNLRDFPMADLRVLPPERL